MARMYVLYGAICSQTFITQFVKTANINLHFSYKQKAVFLLHVCTYIIKYVVFSKDILHFFLDGREEGRVVYFPEKEVWKIHNFF